MKKSNIETIEIGNLIFGNSRGEYSIDRKIYEPMFYKFLEQNGFDRYGCYINPPEPQNYFENDTFSIMPYYWGNEPEEMEKPNFVFKPRNISIQWYKYPLRDAYCTHDISPETFLEMLRICSESLSA